MSKQKIYIPDRYNDKIPDDIIEFLLDEDATESKKTLPYPYQEPPAPWVAFDIRRCTKHSDHFEIGMINVSSKKKIPYLQYVDDFLALFDLYDENIPIADDFYIGPLDMNNTEILLKLIIKIGIMKQMDSDMEQHGDELHALNRQFIAAVDPDNAGKTPSPAAEKITIVSAERDANNPKITYLNFTHE